MLRPLPLYYYAMHAAPDRQGGCAERYQSDLGRTACHPVKGMKTSVLGRLVDTLHPVLENPMNTHRLTLVPALALATVLGAACTDTAPTEPALMDDAAHFTHNAQSRAEIGTTAGWFKGKGGDFLLQQRFRVRSSGGGSVQ